MKEVCCWICKHIEIENGWIGGGETPGDLSVLRCGIGHWDVFDDRYHVDYPALNLRNCLLKAITCKDLEPGPWMAGFEVR